MLNTIDLYVIQRDDGKYVARSGLEHSYTRFLQEAKAWQSYSAAEHELCENDHIIRIQDIFIQLDT